MYCEEDDDDGLVDMTVLMLLAVYVFENINGSKYSRQNIALVM